jgi:hypothetical protein
MSSCTIGGFSSRAQIHGWVSVWGEIESIWYCGHYLPIVPAPDDKWWWLWRNWLNKSQQGKRKYSEKTCPSATLPTTNPTWPYPDSNTGRHGGKPATNRLSYDTAFHGMDLITTPFSRYSSPHKRGSEYEETVVHLPQNTKEHMHGCYSLGLMWKKWLGSGWRLNFEEMPLQNLRKRMVSVNPCTLSERNNIT